MSPVDVPDVATCVVCEVEAHSSDLSRSAFPSGEYRWVCRDVHACARNLAAATDLQTRGRLDEDHDPSNGPGASPRHIMLRVERMTALIKGDY